MRLFLLLPLLSALLWAAEYSAPAGDRAVAPRPGATSVIPGGRLLDPHGRQFATGPGLFGLAVHSKGKLAVTANGGPGEFSLTVLERDQSSRFRVRTIRAPEEGSKEGKSNSWRGVFMGIAFADNKEVFVSEGDNGRVSRIHIARGSAGRQTEVYDLDSGLVRDSYTGDLAYDARRRLLYVVDQANFRIVVIDVRKRKQIASIPVGRLPFAIALSPDGRRAYVTNVGLFEYQAIPDADAARAKETGIDFPAFGFPSPEAAHGVRRRTEEEEVEVPGLGPADTEKSNSLCVIDVANPWRPKVLGYVKTGTPIGGHVYGGSSPSGVLATAHRIYVSNAHNDSISVIDARNLQLLKEIPLRIPGLQNLRGVMPAGIDLHPATGWLLVAEAGINAVAVIDTRRLEVIGHVPAAWYPAAVAVSGDDVYVASALGHGSGANANKMIAIGEPDARGGAGAVTVFPLPGPRDLDRLTQRVLETNGFVPLKRSVPPLYPEEVNYVVLVVKESRTFDEVLGDLGRVDLDGVDGAPMLARFGTTGSASDAGGGFQRRFSLRAVNVTPNHHAMAVRWAFSDNFYADSETSAGGHHSLTGVPPSPWTLSSLLAASGRRKRFRLHSSAPGRRQFAAGASSVHPAEIPEQGTLWNHLERHGVSFRNFGEGFDLAGVQTGEELQPTGVRLLTNVPMPEVLYRNTSRNYPGYNTNIPDQYRIDRFIEEIEARYRKPGLDLPRFLYIHLPNDDMALARPNDGYPFTASFVADNDYALGRLVGYLSTTPWWKNMTIFITEDEGHGGVDHVDAHRVPFLAVGPYVRRDYVSHRNVSFPGLLKTVFRLLGVPPLNLFDAAATDLSDLFTAEPDFTPYEVLEIQKELFVPANARPATRN